MPFENVKTLMFVGWVALVYCVAIVMGIASPIHWIVAACAALVPPAVVRHFWRGPEQTLSESIQDARR